MPNSELEFVPVGIGVIRTGRRYGRIVIVLEHFAHLFPFCDYSIAHSNKNVKRFLQKMKRNFQIKIQSKK